MTGSVLVAGASGLVGTACVERFLDDGWDVTAVSRRRPEVDRPFRHLPLDLQKPITDELPGVTHLVFTAVYEKPGLIRGWTDPEQMSTNLAMLANLLDPLAARGTLEHVTLLQGTKAYGVHLHPIRIPARERHPRDDHANFYWLQEDHLVERAATAGFRYTIMRPQVVIGPNVGVVMNLPPVLGAYAAIRRAEGLPFGFPGGASYPLQAVDTRLVADAIAWAASHEGAHGQHYNLTNGEVFEWRDLWPALADALGADAGPDEPVRLAEYLPARAAVWDDIVAQHGLRPIALPDLLGESHHYADFCLAHGATRPPPPAFVSTVKIKKDGFGGVCDTEESFVHWLRVLQDRKVLPR